MTFQRRSKSTLIYLGVSLLASQAHAIAISDATLHNSRGVPETSTAAILGSGKIKNANINGLTGLFAGDAWSLLDRTNKPSKPFDDVNFLLAADTGQRAGEWGLRWAGTGVPDYMDYVLVLKSGRQWGAYLFESTGLGPDLQELRGDFAISWLNKKGKIAKVRHASIFGRTGSAPVLFVPPPVEQAGAAGDLLGAPVGETGSQDAQAGSQGDQSGEQADPNGASGDLAASFTDAPLAADPNALPIPGTLALLAIGLGLGVRQRQMQHKCGARSRAA